MTPVLRCATTCFGVTGADDSDINKITWKNSSRFLSWDPSSYKPKDRAAVRALRAKGADVDVSDPASQRVGALGESLLFVVPSEDRRAGRAIPRGLGVGQLITGALSDRWGRKWMIVSGRWLQAVALGLIALGNTFAIWAVSAVMLGAGTALVYPTLLASVGDVAHPAWRARAVGTYRLWRDGGSAVGALLAGIVADAFGIRAAIWSVAVLTAVPAPGKNH